MMLAIEQGEVAGLCGISVSSLAEAASRLAGERQVLRAGAGIDGPDPELTAEHVPLTRRFRQDRRRQSQALELMYSQQDFGRPFIAPPGTPAGPASKSSGNPSPRRSPIRRRSRMRSACGLALRPKGGTEVQAVVDKVFTTPPAVVARLKAAIAVTQ